MTTIRIIAAVVDTRQLLMYKADGNTIIIPQGDPRIRPLVDKVIPELHRLQRLKEKVPSTQVFVDLTEAEINQAPTFEETQTHYGEVEKKMGGVVKFFRMAKAKLKELLTPKEPEPVEPTGLVGSLPEVPAPAPPIVPTVEDPLDADELDEDPVMAKDMAAVNEIMANAVSSQSPQFAEGAKDEKTTVVAVMEDGTIIPGMENLDLQLRDIAGKLGNPVGIMKFFERVATVKRGHSVADLLKFMEKGELPIADDGTILVYKRLKSTSEEGVYVDCHSGKVKQRVGSHVFMDEKLVDPNRHRDCSNGLHVARRDYLSSFSGNICVLAKLAPEDVIAVPHSDARKLRAKGYFIIDVLSQEDHNNVTNNRRLRDTNLLGNAVAGNHTPVLETVQITQSYGGGLIITPVAGGVAEVVRDSALSASPLKTEEDIHEENSSVDARTVAVDLGKPDGDHTATVTVQGDAVVDIHVEPVTEKFTAKAPAAQNLSKVQQLVADFENANTPAKKLETAKALVAHKKSVKKSWTALGVSAKIADDANTRVNAVVTAAEVVKPAKASSNKPAGKAKPSAGTKGKTTPAKPAARDIEKPKGKTLPAGKKTAMSKPEQIRALINKGPLTESSAKEILAIKKSAKKGWEVLGVTSKEEEQILKLVK